LAPDRSIAVLPFVNMSSDKEQEYFSDGMSEELLNLLAQVPDLKVIARTSSFAFKGKDVPIADIAKTLNVAHVLEGSVRRSGNTVRITAQLIRTADSTHLWSETYDRPLDDIFRVQDEIANAIVQALQIRLAGGELNRRKGGTQNLEAYQLYLRALSASGLGTKRSVEAASAYLEQAIQIEPNYGQALATLAGVTMTKAEMGLVDPIEGYERARRLLVHALELSPENAAAHARLQYFYWAFDWDWAAAEAEGKIARELDPHDPDVLLAASMLSVGLGQWDAAEKSLKESLALDPQNAWTIWNLGNTYYLAGRFADSEAINRKLLALHPDFGWTRLSLGKTLLAEGKAVEALSFAEQVVDEGERLQYLPVFLDAAGREAEANVAEQAQIARWEGKGAYFIAMTYAYRGDADRAIEWLDRAYQQKDLWLCLLFGEPLFKNIAHDPRFIAFLKKMNLPTEPVPVNWQ
jgi:TolB-like protein